MNGICNFAPPVAYIGDYCTASSVEYFLAALQIKISALGVR
jgi:hypothetical protein